MGSGRLPVGAGRPRRELDGAGPAAVERRARPAAAGVDGAGPVAGGAAPDGGQGGGRDRPRCSGCRSGGVRRPVGEGGNANIGLWAVSEHASGWLVGFLTTDRLRQLLPEAATLEVQRYLLPNLLAVNFVIVGILGEGVASSVRLDPQAKGLGEHLRSPLVDIPTSVLGPGADPGPRRSRRRGPWRTPGPGWPPG